MEQKSHVGLWLVLVFALLGGVLSTWLAPKLIAWYFNPPAQFGVNCVAPIEWALIRFRWIQAGSIIVGGIAGFIVHFLWLRRHRDD